MLLVALPLAAGSRLSDRLATHWDAGSGKPDSSMPLWAATFFPALIWGVMTALVALALWRARGSAKGATPGLGRRGPGVRRCDTPRRAGVCRAGEPGPRGLARGGLGEVAANQNLSAECRLVGGPVTANGISHDKWVLPSDGNYIWGGLLKGNEVGNVSRPCF